MPMRTHGAQSALAINFLLQAAKRLFDGLALFQSDLSQSVFTSFPGRQASGRLDFSKWAGRIGYIDGNCQQHHWLDSQFAELRLL